MNWASAHEPIQATHGLAVGGVFNFVARVEACKAGVLGFERCKAYGAGFKPIGLLQFYGEPDLLYFGLMTGSYAKNKSGGVLRKNAGTFTNEVNPANGTFLVAGGRGHRRHAEPPAHLRLRLRARPAMAAPAPTRTAAAS